MTTESQAVMARLVEAHRVAVPEASGLAAYVYLAGYIQAQAPALFEQWAAEAAAQLLRLHREEVAS